MTDENPIRFVLIGFSILQWTLSIRYLKLAKAGSTIFQRREEGFYLAVGIVIPYLAFVAGVLVYYINLEWMAWSAVAVLTNSRRVSLFISFLFHSFACTVTFDLTLD